MNFVKGIKNYLWGEDKRQESSASPPEPQAGPKHQYQQPRGFKRSVPQGPARRPDKGAKGRAASEPVLQDAPGTGDGGIQSLNWYAAKQRLDEDGSIADAFLVEAGTKMVPKQVRTRPKPYPVEVRAVRGGNIVLSH